MKKTFAMMLRILMPMAVVAGWADGDQKGGFAMQCDKNDYRGVLAGLEGVTGKKATDSATLTVKN